MSATGQKQKYMLGGFNFQCYFSVNNVILQIRDL